MTTEKQITREQLIANLNEDLAREYQAIIAYTVYSQTLKGAAFLDIARELAVQATEEVSSAAVPCGPHRGTSVRIVRWLSRRLEKSSGSPTPTVPRATW